VYGLLRAKGFRVSIVQNPTTSLAADVAATNSVLDQQDGPTILVGHSYGGVVITEAGNHPNVASLVYLAAFAPDEGESVASLISNPPPRAGPTHPSAQGRLPPPRPHQVRRRVRRRSRSRHRRIPRGLAGVQALEGAVTRPAWRNKPSWYVIATDDPMIPPPAQRAMSGRAGSSVSEVKASHALYESQPAFVASAIEQAAR
jgi:pimeloyl-ACP methyl ester carboxylesterase